MITAIPNYRSAKECGGQSKRQQSLCRLVESKAAENGQQSGRWNEWEADMEKRFLLVDAEVLPEVFLSVLKAKELLASGAAKNISAAVKQAGISRSAFYKYKDSIFDADSSRDVTTVTATLLDESGALHDFLEEMYRAGASVVTINQSMPENGTAQVSVALRTGQMHMEVEQLLGRLRTHRTVVDVRRSTI